ncbi:MAG: cytochrome P450 [Candidatus Acidiferrales bacterium]
MDVRATRIPPGPQEEYRAADDLLKWMNHHFSAFGDIFKASAYGANIYATRDVDFAYHVLVENWQNYVKGLLIGRVGLLLGNGLMVSEGDVWKRQRRTTQPSFNRESISAWTGMMAMVNMRLCQKWEAAARQRDSVNVTRDASAMALEVVVRFLVGSDYDHIGPHFDLLTDQKARDMAFARSFRDLRKVVFQLINRRRKERVLCPDVLSALMRAHDDQSGTPTQDEELVDQILTLVVAGHETTASTIGWAWYLLSRHPDVEEKLSNEVRAISFLSFDDLPKFTYTRQVLEEVMRLYPSGWLLTRRSLNDDQLGQYFVPAGTEIYVSPYFIQRHPSLWKDPDRFDPDRFGASSSTPRHSLATIPFSAGPRNCIGVHFARAEMQIHFLTIAGRLRLRYTEPNPPEIDAGVNLRTKQDIIMYPELCPV